jgi:hypothetical protein
MLQLKTARNAGASWFNMPATTDERKDDLEMLRMRSSLDPKAQYKKDDPMPKYSQVRWHCFAYLVVHFCG